MKNYIQPGKTVTVAAPSTVVSGALVIVGALYGVAAYDAASGEPVEIVTEGVFDLAAVTPLAAATVGTLIYATSAGLATTVSTDNTLIGVLVEDKAENAATARVRLNGAY